jgi:endonuclease G, mitochondrial
MKKLCWIAILFFIFSCKEVSLVEKTIDESTLQPISAEIIKHTKFTLAYSEEHKQALWVFYSITPEQFIASPKRRISYKIDTFLKTRGATNEDYNEPVYDKGHLCPAGSMKHDSKAYNETYYLSNISPQLPDFHRVGCIWYKLEQLERSCAKNKKIWVVTGPVLKDNLGAIGKNKVTVPGYFYKVFFNGKDQMIGFIVPHKASNAKPISFAVPVDSVEKMTGIDFFPNLQRRIEKKLESKYDTSYWK